MRKMLLAAVGWVVVCSIARAEDVPKRSPAERREQLQQLSDDLNSPDPLKRLTTMESVLGSNDLLAAEVAMQIALSSGDATMRNYAGLLLLSRAKLINIELKLNPDVQAQVDAAKDDQKKLAEVWAQTPESSALVRYKRSMVSFKFHDFDPNSGAFKSICQSEQAQDASNSFDAQFSGSTLQFRGLCDFWKIPNYNVDNQGGHYRGICSGTMELEGNGVFAGTFDCDGMERPVAASFRLR